MARTIIISLGGSLVYPKNIDTVFLKKFKKLVLDFVKKGNRAVVIVGGGATARNYIAAAHELSPKAKPADLDWIGIRTTRLNAEMVRVMFGKSAYHETIYYPVRKLPVNFKILVAGGGTPGHTTDFDAVKFAQGLNSLSVVNLSNIDYLFDKDPRKFNDARKITSINWNDFRKIVGKKRVPGGNYPFDPIASKLAQENNIEVAIMNGKNLANLKQYLIGKKFKGTLISGY